MAEIRVVEKRGSLAWLWVLIVVIVAALAVWFFLGSRATPTDGRAGATGPATDTLPAPTAPAGAGAATMDSVSLLIAPPEGEMRLVRA